MKEKNVILSIVYDLGNRTTIENTVRAFECVGRVFEAFKLADNVSLKNPSFNTLFKDDKLIVDIVAILEYNNDCDFNLDVKVIMLNVSLDTKADSHKIKYTE